MKFPIKKKKLYSALGWFVIYFFKITLLVVLSSTRIVCIDDGCWDISLFSIQILSFLFQSYKPVWRNKIIIMKNMWGTTAWRNGNYDCIKRLRKQKTNLYQIRICQNITIALSFG